MDLAGQFGTFFGTIIMLLSNPYNWVLLVLSMVLGIVFGALPGLTATLGVARLILGSPQRSSLLNLLRGNILRQVSRLLPENIHLLVCT